MSGQRVLRRWRRKLAKLEGEQDLSLDFYEAVKKINEEMEKQSCADFANDDE